jgi:tRNA-dihydrouridine synthase A
MTQDFGRHRFSVAPMMDWTDSPCRVLHRCLTKSALLYTEMVTAEAVLHGDKARLLGFDTSEHPLALQLGGSDPARLAQATRIAADFGYDEVNLNVGCPSDRVQSGRFGACLMREPALVAQCVTAMRAAVNIPITVKCRIGVDDQDPEAALRALIDACAQAGVTVFAVHARKAWLEGLSPKENRDVPPLDYDLVYRVKRERPDLIILVNGGIETLEQADAHLGHVDGVMLGRAAYHNPGLLAQVDARYFGGPPRDVKTAVEDYCIYVERQLSQGRRLHGLIKPMLGLYNGQPGARLFRRHLSENAAREGAGIKVLREALAFLYREPACAT